MPATRRPPAGHSPATRRPPPSTRRPRTRIIPARCIRETYAFDAAPPAPPGLARLTVREACIETGRSYPQRHDRDPDPAIDEARAEAESLRQRLRNQLFIDGAFRDATTGRRFTSENPATGEPIAEIAEGGPADVDEAVAAARRAADDGRWSRLRPADRKRILVRWADLIEAHGRELGLIERLDAGKPITDTVGLDIPETAACIRWHAEAIDKLYDQVAPTRTGPWPRSRASRSVSSARSSPGTTRPRWRPGSSGPSLATGNSVVIKPASADLAEPAADRRTGRGGGMPDGVLNVVPDPGERRSARRSVATPTSTAVAFTGSTEVGRRFLHCVGRDQPQARAPRARRQEPAARHGRRRRPRADRRAGRHRDLLEHGRELLARARG